MRALSEVGALIGWALATRPDVSTRRLAYDLSLSSADIVQWRTQIEAVLPPKNRPAATPLTRAALLAWHLAQRTMSVAEMMVVIQQPRNSTHALLTTLSRCVPIYDVQRRWGCEASHKLKSNAY